jgi:hypothetical protein
MQARVAAAPNARASAGPNHSVEEIMQLNSIVKAVLLSTAAASMSFIVSNSAPAEAAEVVHATACLYQGDHTGDYVVDSTGVANQSNGLGWRPRSLFCPISTSVRQTLTGSVLLDVYDGDNTNASSGRVLATACVQSYSGSGMSCSAPTEITLNTETGSFSRGLDSDDLNLLRDPAKSYWYATLNVQLPAWNIAKSKLYGYTAF